MNFEEFESGVKRMRANYVESVKNMLPTVEGVNTPQVIKKLARLFEEDGHIIEECVVPLALETNTYLSIGNYGDGRTLLLEDDSYSRKSRGDWLYSYETC